MNFGLRGKMKSIATNRFCRTGVALVIVLAIIIRFALWALRRTFARQLSQRDQAKSMISGYRQVLSELPTL